jgi:hypothetical protein
MKPFAPLLALTLAAIAMPALAAEPTPQQNKMKSCNAEAKSKDFKGDERKAFMKTCLSAKAEAPAESKTEQQNKMKTCNADAKAKALKGDERKAFMSSCLKG